MIPFQCERIPQGQPPVVLCLNDTFIVHMSGMDARRLSVALATEATRILQLTKIERPVLIEDGAHGT